MKNLFKYIGIGIGAGLSVLLVIQFAFASGTVCSVNNGCTGWGSIQSGTILYGNGTGRISTTTAGTAGNILALLNGIPTWTSTTTFSSGLVYSAGNVTLDSNFNKGFFFSTTSTDYYKSVNNFFSTTSAIYFVDSSTTIPKTYTSNTYATAAKQTIPYASTTALTIVTASTTNLYVSGAANGSTQCAQIGADGKITGTGSACGSGGGGTFSWTPTTNFGAAANATDTAIWLRAGLQASSTSKLSTTTVTGAFTVNYGNTEPNGGKQMLAVGGSLGDPWSLTIGENNFNSTAPAQLIFGEYSSSHARPEFIFNGVQSWTGLGQLNTSNDQLRMGCVNGPASDWPTTFGTFCAGSSMFSLNIDGGLGIGYADLPPENGAIIIGNTGIGTSTPFAKLAVHADDGDTNTTLFVVASSTSNSTTTLFSIDNTGAASTTYLYGAQLSACNGSTQKLLWNNGQFSCGTDQTGGGGTFPFTAFSNYNATSTTIGFLNGIFSTASSTFSSDLNISGQAGKATTTIDEGFKIAPSGSVSASVSAGGIFNLTNTSNDGAGAVFFTNHGSGATGRLAVFDCNSASFDTNCVHIQGQGTQSILNIQGSVNNLGTIKVSGLSGAASTNNSALLSLDASVNSYQGQGVFIKGNAATTTAVLNILDGSSNTLFKVDGNGLVSGLYSSTTKMATFGTASTTNLYVSGAANGSTQCAQIGADGKVTGTGSACGSGGGGSDAFTHPAAGQSATTSQLILSAPSGMLSIGSSTPWGLLSIASSSPNYAQNQPIVAIATSTNPWGWLGGFWATSTTLAIKSPISGQIWDSGARFAVGTTQTYDYPGLLDQATFNGRINTEDWHYLDCSLESTTGVLSAATASVCGPWSFGRDAAGTLQQNDPTTAGNSGITSFMICTGGNTCAATFPGVSNNGVGLFAGPLTNGIGTFVAATNTPIMEMVARPYMIEFATSSTFYFGFSNLSPGGTTYEVEPTVGCYFVASSTIATGNFEAICRTSAAAQTVIDTGFASSTVVAPNVGAGFHAGSYMRFRISMDANHAVFYMATSGAPLRIVADINTNYPGTNSLNSAGVWVSQTTGGHSVAWQISSAKMWLYNPALTY